MLQIFAQQSPPPDMLVPMLVGGLVGLVLGSLFGALMLRAACSVYNRSCPEDNRVNEPAFGKAVGVMFIRNFIMLMVTGMVGIAIPQSPSKMAVLGAISLLISFLVGIVTLIEALPTTGRRAANIVGLELLFSLVLWAILGGAAFLITKTL